jgi:hypothetical protein
VLAGQRQLALDLQSGLPPAEAYRRLQELADRLRPYGVSLSARNQPLTVTEAEIAAIRRQAGDDPARIMAEVQRLYRERVTQEIGGTPHYSAGGRTLTVPTDIQITGANGQTVPLGVEHLRDPVLAQLAMASNRTYLEELTHALQFGVFRTPEGRMPMLTMTPETRALSSWMQTEEGARAMGRFLSPAQLRYVQRGPAGMEEVDPHILWGQAATNPAALQVARQEAQNYFPRVLYAMMQHSRGRAYLGMQGEELASFIRQAMQRWP